MAPSVSDPAPAPANATDTGDRLQTLIGNGLKNMKALETLVAGPEAFGVRRMCIALRDEVVAMPEDARDPYVRRLRRMPSIELTRENNMARNRAWTVQLGLGSVAAFVGMKKKREREDGEERQNKKAKKNGEADWEDNDSDDDESSDDEGVGRGTPPATRGRARKNAPAQAKGKSAGWAETSKKMLLEGGMGKVFEEVVELWWRQEEKTGFVSKVRVCLKMGGTVTLIYITLHFRQKHSPRACDQRKSGLGSRMRVKASQRSRWRLSRRNGGRGGPRSIPSGAFTKENWGGMGMEAGMSCVVRAKTGF
jgi:hypothetical protein